MDANGRMCTILIYLTGLVPRKFYAVSEPQAIRILLVFAATSELGECPAMRHILTGICASFTKRGGNRAPSAYSCTLLLDASIDMNDKHLCSRNEVAYQVQ